MSSDLAFIRLHTETLYELDPAGRLRSVNEPDGPPAPRLFVGRTRIGHLWWFRHDVPDAVVGEIEALLRAEPTPADLAQPPTCLGALRAILETHAPIGRTWFGPAWRFPDAIAEPAGAVPVPPANVALVRRTFPDLVRYLPARQPCLAVVEDGEAVSVCFSARNAPRAAEAGVETLDGFRGRGYAAATVAAWARAVRREGRTPLYSTSWGNLASQAVARRLGLILFGADFSLG